MPLVFSPLGENVIDGPPRRLHPRSAFLMRQIGKPPPIDLRMFEVVGEVFAGHGIASIDATTTIGGKDFLERIVDLIRSTGFTVAIFSHRTRPATLANIMLELGFAAMLGKPLIIVKSARAVAPSDLKRTDWIDYAEGDEATFRSKLVQAIAEIEGFAAFQGRVLEIALEARSTDCAVALEHAIKGYLLSGQDRFLNCAERLLDRLDAIAEGEAVSDLERLRGEVRHFLKAAPRPA